MVTRSHQFNGVRTIASRFGDSEIHRLGRAGEVHLGDEGGGVTRRRRRRRAALGGVREGRRATVVTLA